MKKVLSLLYILLAGIGVLAQERMGDSVALAKKHNDIDSLKIVYNKYKTDRTRAFLELGKISKEFEDISYDSSEFYKRKSVELLPTGLDSSKMDSTIVNILCLLGGAYMFHNMDSAMLFSKRAIDYSNRISYRMGQAVSNFAYGENLRLNGDLLKALEMLFQGLSIFRELGDKSWEAQCKVFIGIAYSNLGQNRTALDYMLGGMPWVSYEEYKPLKPFVLSNIGDAYENLGILDTALDYQLKAKALTDQLNARMSPLGAEVYTSLGKFYMNRRDFATAKSYLYDALLTNDYLNLPGTQYLLADLYYERGQSDSSLYFSRLAFQSAQKSRIKLTAMNVSRLLARIFSDRKKMDSAYYYQTMALAFSDSLFSPQKFNSLQLRVIETQQKENELKQLERDFEQQKIVIATRSRMYGLGAALVAFTVILVILFRNNRQKQKANLVLNHQKNELSQTLTELKNTQAQLVQSEKMASLGELTAGIAHEIQNPLNFVNNFSDVNSELISELKAANEKGDKEDVNLLAQQINENNEKIVGHGKRADSIVKGMLQHSRASAGQKEPTDLNALCDEYLRLCFHGMRAKNKLFNANLQTQFEENLPKINVVSQDLGRVLLNLFNNAFYATAQLVSTEPGNGYEPTIVVSTKKLSSGVEIRIIDNGPGIPETIRGKIFQPFFTTKPTGQGTGLGLSLSYDIVKAHGGEIKVNSKNGEGAEFIILIPA